MAYKKPAKRVHRGFFYLNDETVINSLSAVESGKIDEVVAKVNSAREGGFAGGLNAQVAKFEGGKKSTSGFEEEMVRTRTRFSIFELWYENLKDQKAIGTFDDWGPDALSGVLPGDTVELRAELEVAPIQTLFRLFIWFAEQAATQGTLFSQKGDELKATKEAARNFKMFLGADEDNQVVVLARPLGASGPVVAMPLNPAWLIGRLGYIGGEYTIVAQVDRLLGASDEVPTLRLTRDIAATPRELALLKESMTAFIEPSKAMGVVLTGSEASVMGPGLWIDPIAIYK